MLPAGARSLAVAIVIVCLLVTVAEGIWLRHGMETGCVDRVVDARIRADLGGHPLLLAVLVWPGAPVPTTVMAVALVLTCFLRRRYAEATLVATSMFLAVTVTELVLKPLIGRTQWGDPFPSGHVTSVVALATALMVLLARTPRLLRLGFTFTAFLIAIAVALGVIGARLHYFTDAVGGAAVGAGTVLLTALILDNLNRRLRSSGMAQKLRVTDEQATPPTGREP